MEVGIFCHKTHEGLIMNVRCVKLGMVASTIGCLVPVTSQARIMNESMWAAACCTAAVATSAAYGHVFLPWVTRKMSQSSKKKASELRAQEQEKRRAQCYALAERYTVASMPASGFEVLCAYRDKLAADIETLKREGLDFTWDNPAMRDGIVTLVQRLEEHARHAAKIIGLRVALEAQEEYREELALLDTDVPEVTKLSRIIHEKFGDKIDKFTLYKAALTATMERCRHFGAPDEVMQKLSKLNKGTNYLFSTPLAEELTRREADKKRDKIFEAEMFGKASIQKFYEDAHKHVQRSTQIVEQLAQEVAAHNQAQRGITENCTNLLHSIKGMLAMSGIHSERQKERILYAINEQSEATRAVIRDMLRTEPHPQSGLFCIRRSQSTAQPVATPHHNENSSKPSTNHEDKPAGPDKPSVPPA